MVIYCIYFIILHGKKLFESNSIYFIFGKTWSGQAKNYIRAKSQNPYNGKQDLDLMITGFYVLVLLL